VWIALAVVIIGLWYLSQQAEEGVIPLAAGGPSDQVVLVAQAIAKAEGYGIPGAIPTTHNNPGDITDSSGAKITYPDPATGWNALYNKIQFDLVTGLSHVYSPNMTWQEVAWMWVAGTQPGGNHNGSDYPDSWAATVTNAIGVQPLDRCGDYFGV
jgi:hypothetical protein